MSKTLKLTIIMGLYWLIVETGVFAQPTLKPRVTVNGTVEVAYYCTGTPEFPPNWTQNLVFVEAPNSIYVRWSGKNPAEWAQWELYKFTVGPDQKLASGNLSGAILSNTSSTFEIKLQPPLPRFNTTPGDQKYRLLVKS
ncbi:MAG TPA: hypothetical protein VNM22_00800 [Candidatus Limnocylindrales bacterium]|nr:hypothetical protein [Candidatus Limnocylindrales bacterium]